MEWILAGLGIGAYLAIGAGVCYGSATRNGQTFDKAETWVAASVMFLIWVPIVLFAWGESLSEM